MSLPAPRMSPPATRWRGSIDRRSGGREWGRPSPDLFASRGRRGRARPGRAFADVDPVTLFAGGDTGGVARDRIRALPGKLAHLRDHRRIDRRIDRNERVLAWFDRFLKR